ncbi:Bicyclomycin resistance protein [Zhongshania aliphaticivorans]|uniref:Bcr/CflA family efflux transporter n=1 Tax=Zhongshania aliphaticivorans TaxID=1470434 RepID=A0A5S9NAM1_9GAMM|nr:multidrug effflux MFS transporter [Zhongshania aliphaticivorans]CAA0079105.1 Bicyclomycin resistance protein [Zhongshania aliphaticivorans]CAA0086363.1 Bicyclomycin resistance protein [Zhongshania aliphaticivorans]
MISSMPPLRVILALALIFALSPLAIDMYLPTIPAIAGELAVPVQDIAVTVSLYILGLSFGQFFGGPISDYIGRQPVLYIGLGIFAAASLAIASTDVLHVFWVARFLQALGGGFASVVVPAIIRDHTEGQATAKLFSQIMLITIIAPAVAPSIGTFLYSVSGWRMVFFVLAGYTLLVFLMALLFVPRSSKSLATSMAPAQEGLVARYRFVLSNRVAMRYLVSQGLAFSVMVTFLANAALIYIDHYGVTETQFSMLFAANIVTLAVANRVNNYFLNRVPAARILPKAMVLQCFATAALLISSGFMPPLWIAVPLIMASVGALGGVMGNSQASALQFFPHHSGIASALLGSAQYLIAGLVSVVSTLFLSEKMWPMTITMFVAAAIALWVVPKPPKDAFAELADAAK